MIIKKISFLRIFSFHYPVRKIKHGNQNGWQYELHSSLCGSVQKWAQAINPFRFVLSIDLDNKSPNTILHRRQNILTRVCHTSNGTFSTSNDNFSDAYLSNKMVVTLRLYEWFSLWLFSARGRLNTKMRRDRSSSQTKFGTQSLLLSD